MSAEFYFNIANIFFLIGTSCLFIKIIKNRNSLKDFDKIGSFLTFSGLCFSTLAVYELKMYITVILSIPSLLFWLFAFIFSLKQK